MDPAGQDHEAFRRRVLHQRLCEIRVGLIRVAVLDEFHRDHRAEIAHLADRGEAVADADAVICDRKRRVIDLAPERPERRLVRRNLARERQRRVKPASHT